MQKQNPPEPDATQAESPPNLSKPSGNTLLSTNDLSDGFFSRMNAPVPLARISSAPFEGKDTSPKMAGPTAPPPGSQTVRDTIQLASQNDPAAVNAPVGNLKFDPKYGDEKTPPATKIDVLKKYPGSFESFSRALDRLQGVGPDAKFALRQIYALEGGNAVDPASNASSGITPATLALARQNNAVSGLSATMQPKDLSADQRAELYQWYLNQAFRHVGGIQILDDLHDQKAAGALADAVVRLGHSGGMRAVQRAMNQTTGSKPVDVDGGMGAQTWQILQTIIADPAKRNQFLGKLAEQRESRYTTEKERNEHFAP